MNPNRVRFLKQEEVSAPYREILGKLDLLMADLDPDHPIRVMLVEAKTLVVTALHGARVLVPKEPVQ